MAPVKLSNMKDLFLSATKVLLDGPVGTLEVAVDLGSKDGAYRACNTFAVIAHPHPLHGGTMDNKVVTTLMRSYRELGVDVLRFNFRGVGRSTGEHDHAVGELDDMLAVLRAGLVARPQARPFLAGFSFGSSVAARASYQVNTAHLCLVAPPVPRYDFESGGAFPAPLSILQGEADERVEESEVRQWVGGLSGEIRYHAFPATGHFFHGQLVELKQLLTDDINQQCPVRGLL
ncbi:alpha/beta hydrolase [Gilvimarinus chinensis]|uniref:alpha/beta hydrolase n=1 Tax=Gilvimarinus chinensis TaxID=396005 RepID=UPI000379E65D|nr:alpha/beta fold hydrolase [Gilvimarinus chinensis]